MFATSYNISTSKFFITGIYKIIQNNETGWNSEGPSWEGIFLFGVNSENDGEAFVEKTASTKNYGT
jgi:hypothetical protein